MWQKFKKILFCMFPHVETFRRQWNVNHIYRKENSKMTNGCMKWRNKRENLREKSFLSWQNIWNSRQITTDIKEKLGNKGGLSWRRIQSCIIYLSLWNKWRPCHGAINSRPRNLRMALEKYFWFHWNCKQLRVEARNSMSNCES